MMMTVCNINVNIINNSDLLYNHCLHLLYQYCKLMKGDRDS